MGAPAAAAAATAPAPAGQLPDVERISAGQDRLSAELAEVSNRVLAIQRLLEDAVD
ncbi:hypothetical protein ACFQ2B_17145 [Streptomyces stramineus]